MHILIVDDHPSFRRGVKEILTEELDSAKIGEAGDAQEMLDLLRRKKWDLVIMDISMPGQTGPEALKALNAPEVKARMASLGVEVVTMEPAAFNAYIKAEMETAAQIARTANLKAQ